jgi:hypothetical protein
MYLLFVDESGRPDERMFAVGGIAVRADEWHLLHVRWRAALEAHGWPVDRELKWHGTRTGEVPPALANAVFDALAGAPITCFAVLLRPLAARQRRPDLFATDDDVCANALRFLGERYQRFLARHDAYGVIVLDSRRDGRSRSGSLSRAVGPHLARATWPEPDECVRRLQLAATRTPASCVRDAGRSAPSSTTFSAPVLAASMKV